MSFIKNIDFLGKRPLLFINGKTSNKSNLGGLLSILTALLVVSSSAYFIYLLVSRTSFSVILSEEFNPWPTKSWYNSEFSIMLQNRFLNDVVDKERIYGITAQTWSNKPNKQPDGSIKYVTEILPVEMEKCDVSRNFAGGVDLWKNQKLINDSYCIKTGQNISSIKLFGENDYTGVVLWIHKCQNSTTKTDCYPDEYITKELQNVFVLTRFRDYYLDHQKVGDPGKPSSTQIYSKLRSVPTREFGIFFEMLTIIMTKA